MQNSTVVAALIADPVPTNRECVTNLTDILQGVVDFVHVDALASVSGGSSLPTTNNAAAQAQETANAALAAANAAQEAIPGRRTSGSKVTVPAGDSNLVLAWDEPLATPYEVHLTFFGSATHPAAYYGYRVVDGTETANNVQVSLDNIPSGSSMTWSVTQL